MEHQFWHVSHSCTISLHCAACCTGLQIAKWLPDSQSCWQFAKAKSVKLTVLVTKPLKFMGGCRQTTCWAQSPIKLLLADSSSSSSHMRRRQRGSPAPSPAGQALKMYGSFPCSPVCLPSCANEQMRRAGTICLLTPSIYDLTCIRQLQTTSSGMTRALCETGSSYRCWEVRTCTDFSSMDFCLCHSVQLSRCAGLAALACVPDWSKSNST